MNILLYRFAGSKTCISEVASQFCIGESTFHRQCGRVMHHLNDIAPSIIRFPKDNEEKKAIAHHFEQVIFHVFSVIVFVNM